MLCGLRVEQAADWSITVSQHEYTQSIEEVPVGKSASNSDLVDAATVSRLRGAIGALMWAGTQNSPLAFSYASQLASRIVEPTNKLVRAINKAIRQVKLRSRQALKLHSFKNGELGELYVCTLTDAAHANRPGGASSGGHITGLSNKAMADGDVAPLSILGWSSSKLCRITRSSGGSEVQAAANGED